MEETKKYRTDFLFSTPTFIIGAGSSFNLSGNYFEFNTSETSEKADLKAIKNDWNVIGEDLKLEFIKHIENKLKSLKEQNGSKG